MSEHTAEKDAAVFEWDVNVRRKNTYGDKIVSTTQMTVLAATKSEVTAKVRAAFEAKYDDFRKFWSHDWTLNSVREVHPLPPGVGRSG